MSRQRGLNIPAGLGNTFAGNHALQECLAEYKKPIKAFQGKLCYPSLTFFCHRWFCLVNTSY